MRYNAEKLSQLILYIANKSVGDQRFGATKLNKILFFSDFMAHAELGHAITGAEYQCLEHGPAPHQLLPLQRELIDAGRAAVVPVGQGQYVQKRMVALVEPDLTQFSEEEIALVDKVISLLRNRSATQVSDLSHKWSVGWQVASEGEVIPYDTVFWAAPAPGHPALQRARELEARWSA